MLNQQNQNIDLNRILMQTLSPEENIRVLAIETIEKISKENFGLFLFGLSKILSNEKGINNIRLISATIIKNKIKNFMSDWLQLEENCKSEIKNNILATLIDPDIIVKKATALCIEGICSVEFPKNLWNNVFDILINASKNNNLEIKITTLITLGYIFEDITIKNIKEETIINITKIYYSILAEKNNNEQQNKILIKNCLLSLKKFVPFLENIIKEDDTRLLFFNLIGHYLLDNDEDIRAYSIEIFSEIIYNHYDYYPNYIDTLMQTLFQIIEKDSERNKKCCIELFFSIGEKEMELIE